MLININRSGTPAVSSFERFGKNRSRLSTQQKAQIALLAHRKGTTFMASL